MIDKKIFNGVMDLDSSEYTIQQNSHKYARNIRFPMEGSFLQAQNVKGNYAISNSSLPSGNNECIGSFFDQVNDLIFWFNWNQNGNHGIYQLDIQTETITQIFRCGVNSATDIFNFSLNYPVHSCAIVYQEPGQGNLLYWTDGYNRPRYINVSTVSSLSPFTEDMINAGKNAPLEPATCAYADDANVNVNNLRKKLFRFSYRWLYANREKSTFSPISKMAFDDSGFNLNTNNDPTKNNNIQVLLTAGGEDSTAIEIVGQSNVDDTWSDFFFIDTLDLVQYGISPGGTYTYSFYNNGAYPTIPIGETDLYFSWLPDKANTMEALNGDVLIYGGITEGYDQLQRNEVDVTVTVGLSAPNIPIISYAYAGAHEVTIYIGPIIQVGAIYTVYFIYSSGAGGDASPKNVSYTTIGGNTQNSIVNSLAALLTGNNILATNLGAGYLRVITSTGTGSITNVLVGVSVAGSEVAAQSWKWSCTGRTGLVYFDDRGKTNGVISFVGDTTDTTDFAFTLPNFATNSNVPQVPIVSASINHTPPTWAVSYQWVRANLLPTKFLYWVTNDYYAESDYIYFCIQNLVDQNVKNTGFVPSYEFTEGDRIRVIAAYTASNFVPYNIQLDMEIVGTVQKTMHTPATSGLFIKCALPSTLPSAPYQYQMLIELYTPKPTNSDKTQLFYEWGEKYDIYTSGGNRYHRGQIADQTASQPATFQWFDGDVYYRPRTFYESASPSVVSLTEYFMDANYSDYFQSAVNSNGRGWAIDLNAKQRYNGNQVRWGGQFSREIGINELNIFEAADEDFVDLSKGDIRRLRVRDRQLRVFQDRGIGQYGIYARYIQNNAGDSQLVTTNDIITTNNINYYQGTYGLCGYPTNLASNVNADYLTDIITGRSIRLSSDGLTDLGLLYKGQYYLPTLVLPYNGQLLRPNGSIAKVMGFFDAFDNQYHQILQDSTTTDPSNVSFNEDRNGFCSFYDIHAEWYTHADGVNYQWSGGILYKQNSSVYCNFFGVQYNAEITLVFNQDITMKKSWQAITQTASDIWQSPTKGDIETDGISYGTTKQQSHLVNANYRVLESKPSSAFYRDENSRGGWINGDFLKGSYLKAKLVKQNASNFITLTEVEVLIKESPLNTK